MPKKDLSLGRTLIRAHKRGSNFVIKDGFRHTSELPDGRDFARLNLKSVTEQTSLDDFLSKAELAESDFISEFSEMKIIEAGVDTGILSENEKAVIALAQDKNKDIISIPRRPPWSSDTTKEELDRVEKESFLDWRRKLAVLQEEEHINLTPFERNLEVWRQLWRVIERSDVVVQILDSRNPLLFRCPDLEKYVKEVDNRKSNLLLLNKADFLTEDQRQHWCEYFEKNGVRIAFFSALEQINRTPEEDGDTNTDETADIKNSDSIKNSSRILSREQLLSFLKSVPAFRSDENVTVVGLVGYPNVGKSSTINAILMAKKVSVSATPGKTKHFQTFLIEKDLCLCDCPGLVFPNFISTKAEMVTNGILPIDQLTNWVQPVTLITTLIPRKILETTYSIFITTPGENRDSNSIPTADEFLNAYGYSRGFMTAHGGIPDNARSARYILKDFVNGKLLYCHAPPGVDQQSYHKYPEVKLKNALDESPNKKEKSLQQKPKLSEADKRFFTRSSGVHIKGRLPNQPLDAEANAMSNGKPWKMHHNRNKKEKLRRIYRHAYEDF